MDLHIPVHCDEVQTAVKEIIAAADRMGQFCEIIVHICIHILFIERPLRIDQLQQICFPAVQDVGKTQIPMADRKGIFCRTRCDLLIQPQILLYHRINACIVCSHGKQCIEPAVGRQLFQIRHTFLQLLHIEGIRNRFRFLLGNLFSAADVNEVKQLIQNIGKLLRADRTMYEPDRDIGHMIAFHRIAGTVCILPVIIWHDKPHFHIVGQQIIKLIFRFNFFCFC